MYIIKNACKNIIRNKGRNILMIIIAIVIALSACVSLSIREAARKAKEETVASMTVTAQLTFDRSKVMSQMRGDGENSGGFDRGKFDFNSLSGTALTLDDYMGYAELMKTDDTYYYTMTGSLNASGEILPYGSEESEESEDTQTNTETASNNGREGMGSMGGMGGMGGKGMMNSADFSLTGYSNYTAMLSQFGNDGTYTITTGTMFDETSTDLQCIISDELAMYNNISAGDTIILANPHCAAETYKFTVTGIYNNSASESGNSRFSFSDPANNIYLNTTALQDIFKKSEESGNMSDDDKTVSAVMTGETNFTYVFASAENYYSFDESATAKGLPENYTINSADISSYEKGTAPLDTLSTMTGWFFLIMLIIGGIVLVILNIFNLRERKYEVGVLTAIGMKKHKVAMQFVCELFIITFTSIIIGAAAGACVSVPVTNTLLESQVEKVQEADEEVANNFGMGRQNGSNQSFSKGGHFTQQQTKVNYIDSVSSATDFTVILQLILVGLVLTVVSSLAALITIMRYEPLKILSSRS